MTLLLSLADAQGFLSPATAIQVIEQVVREEVEGTTLHIPPFGGSGGSRPILRVVGGGLFGLNRVGLRAGLRGAVALLYDATTLDLLAVIGHGFAQLRVGATMGLAARYLARPDARTIGMLGSGQNALAILECLQVVRPVERVRVFSPTQEHRTAFAHRATESLDIPVTAHDTPDAVLDDADIVVVATNSRSPVLRSEQLRPGVHVTSMGVPTELDASVYLTADQFVAASRAQEIESTAPGPHTVGHVAGGALHDLLQAGRFQPASIVELGAIVKGDVAPRNGPRDVNLFRESRGGVGDIALANYVYEQARARGLGTEFDFS